MVSGSLAGIACTASWWPVNFQCGWPARGKVPVPAPLGATHRTHEDFVVANDHPDHDRAVWVPLGPDRDLLRLVQFAQNVSIEIRHGLHLRPSQAYHLRSFAWP